MVKDSYIKSCPQHKEINLKTSDSFQSSYSDFQYCVLTFLLLLLTGFDHLYAQPTIQWDKTIGGSNSDFFETICQTRDGGYLLGGWSISPISSDKTESSKGGYDYWVVKLNADGTKVWDKTFGGKGWDRLLYLQQTSDGGYILGGWSASSISGDKTEGNKIGQYKTNEIGDFWIIKLHADGSKAWDKTIGGRVNENFGSLQQTSDGGYILGGSSYSDISGDKTEANNGNDETCDYWVVKLDATGNKVWDKTLGGSRDDILTSIQQTGDGGYILGGSSESGISGDKTQLNKGNSDYWVVQIDASGKKVWDTTIDGIYHDKLNSIQQAIDGGYIIGGPKSDDTTNVIEGQSTAYRLVKLYANGSKAWDKVIWGNGFESLESLQLTSDGGYILGGYSNSGINADISDTNNKGGVEYWVVKLHADGSKAWDKTIGGNADDNLLSVQQTKDGGYLLGGWSYSGSSGDKTEASIGGGDYWVVKLNSSNYVPEAASQQLQTEEEEALSVQLTGTDADNSALTFAITQQPTHGTLSGTNPHFVYTPSPNYHGSDAFTYTANDGLLTSLPATIAITVLPVNDAPELTIIPKQEVSIGALLSFSSAATDIDDPLSSLRFSMTGAPSGAQINPSTGLFTWTPAQNQAGGHTFTIFVSDGKLADLKEVFIMVNAVNGVTLAMDSVSGYQNGKILIPVRVRDYKNLLSLQGSIIWNSTVASFVGLEAFGLPGLTSANFGKIAVAKGQLTFSWHEPNAIAGTLPDGAIIFTLQLKLIGAPGTSTAVSITNTPVSLEVISNDYSAIPVAIKAGAAIVYNEIGITGNVISPTGIPLDKVVVKATGNNGIQTSMTPGSGTYAFKVTAGKPYKLAPVERQEGDVTNGVTTLDLVQVQRHILNTQSLTSPYKIIAADANNSGTVTTLDMVLIRALILRNIADFPNNRMWAFVKSDYAFSNPAQPFPYDDTRTYSGSSELTNQDFIGIKVGDVNDSWDASKARILVAGDVTFNLGNRQVAMGEEILIPVTVRDFSDVSGYQFTLDWDPDVLAFTHIGHGGVEGAYGMQRISEGKLTTVWTDPMGKSLSLKDGESAFSVGFKVIGENGSATNLSIGAMVSSSVAYNGNLEELNIQSQQSLVEVSGLKYALHQNYPNPFSNHTTLHFRLPEAQEVKLSIYNALGQLVTQLGGRYKAGEHFVTWKGVDAQGIKLNTGTYYCRMQAGNFTESVQLVLGE